MSDKPEPPPTHFAFPLEFKPLFERLLVAAQNGAKDMSVLDAINKLMSRGIEIAITSEPE